MLDLNNIKRAYFIGIGGIGMSAIARYFNESGVKVSGYDKTSSPLTEELQKEGMHVHFVDDPEQIDKAADLVVYTPAIPNDHLELNYFIDHKYLVMKRAEALGEITKGKYTIAVAGSHGKTTVSSMIAHILVHSGYQCTAFLGGIAVNYQSNFINRSKDVFVVEADEYDRSFLQLEPDIAIITSIDSDHLDIYGSKENVVEAFQEFANKIKDNGRLILKSGTPNLNARQNVSISSYDLLNEADFYVSSYSIQSGGYQFDISTQGQQYQFEITIGGIHNIENAVAAIAACQYMDVTMIDIASALKTFSGIKRRFEKIYDSPELVYIDDYAHHPSELESLIRSVKELYPGKPLTVIFQPHLYSRTRDLADQFARSLDLADKVILMEIYPAREQPIEGISSQIILDKMNLRDKAFISDDIIIDQINPDQSGVLLTVGAGDIDQLIPIIHNKLKSN